MLVFNRNFSDHIAVLFQVPALYVNLNLQFAFLKEFGYRIKGLCTYA